MVIVKIGTVGYFGRVHFIEEATNPVPEDSDEFFDALTACGRHNTTFVAEVWDGTREEVTCKDCIAVAEGRRYGKDLVEDPS